MRRALALSLERGKGREAAVHYGNLATDTSHYEGPAAALAACREATAFCERRGISELELVIGSYSLIYEAELGGTAEVLARAVPLAEEAEATGIAPIAVTDIEGNPAK